MGQEFFRPTKKFISRIASLTKLKLNYKQFDQLCILLGIYPIVAEKRNCFDKSPGWFYLINDIKRIYYSEAYDIVKMNAGKDRKRKELLGNDQFKRCERIIDEEMSLIPLVKNRYSSFGESLCDVGSSIRGLYFVQLFSICDVSNTLSEFEDFVLDNKFLKAAFMARNGIYYQMSFEGKIVLWMVPYPGKNLNDLVEEKVLIEEKMKFLGRFEFDSSEESIEEESEVVDKNDPKRQDTSLLKYSAPLFETHVKLVIHKLCLLYKDHPKKTVGIFSGKKVFVDIKSIKKDIEFVLKSEFAEIVSIDEAEIVISEKVDAIKDGCVYLQPQYVFDSLNSAQLLEYSLYTIGKKLPPHESPFPDIFNSISPQIIKTLSNRKRNMLFDKVQELN